MRHRARTSDRPATHPADVGHVVIHGGRIPEVVEGDAPTEWARMHLSLAAWKTARLLQDALAEVRRASHADSDPLDLAGLERAEHAMLSALQALEELAPPR
jgi:hypothetical protein